MAENSGHLELTPEQAVIGPFLFIVLRETAHALIHILAVPVLGQEEDAADQVAVLAATRLGGEFAERMLRAAAFMYDHDSRARKLGEADFADVHGLDRQRFHQRALPGLGRTRSSRTSRRTWESTLLPRRDRTGTRRSPAPARLLHRRLHGRPCRSLGANAIRIGAWFARSSRFW